MKEEASGPSGADASGTRSARREFKFRAWHGASKRMISWDLLLVLMRGDQVWIPAKVPPTLAMTPDSEYMRQWTLHGNPFQMAALDMLQWTGLQDKHGRDIYEGDILSANLYPFMDQGGQNYVAYVEWIEPGFVAVKQCVNPGRRGISSGIAEDLDGEYPWEVLGNIYENPELMGNP